MRLSGSVGGRADIVFTCWGLCSDVVHVFTVDVQVFKIRQRIWRHEHLVDVSSAHKRRRARIHPLERIQRGNQGEDGCRERQKGGNSPTEERGTRGKTGKISEENGEDEAKKTGGKRGRFQKKGEDSQNCGESSSSSTIYGLDPRL